MSRNSRSACNPNSPENLTIGPLAIVLRWTNTQMQVQDRPDNLSPGMAVMVEVKTGSRRIISYLLSPLLKFKPEPIRER